MNALNMARTAYASPAAAIRSPRRTEYDTIAQITARMKAAADRGATGFADLVAALHDNRRLWIVLASDVADAKNELPGPLRAQIFYLAEFTLRHTSRVLEGKAGIDVLTEINTAILRGLRQAEVAA